MRHDEASGEADLRHFPHTNEGEQYKREATK